MQHFRQSIGLFFALLMNNVKSVFALKTRNLLIIKQLPTTPPIT